MIHISETQIGTVNISFGSIKHFKYFAMSGYTTATLQVRSKKPVKKMDDISKKAAFILLPVPVKKKRNKSKGTVSRDRFGLV
jgi:hypothetical protein